MKMHNDEIKRFTIFWMNGQAEVISAFPDETFHSAFIRHGYGMLATATMSMHKEGSVLQDYRFDKSGRWLSRDSNAVRDYNHLMHEGHLTGITCHMPYVRAI